MESPGTYTVHTALAAAEELARQDEPLSLPRLLASLPVRGRDAAIFCAIAAPVVAAMFIGAWAQYSGGWAWAGAAIAGGAIAYAGARTCGAWRGVKLMRQIRAAQRGRPSRLVDIVGYAEATAMTSTQHARGYRTVSVRVHDHPATALAAWAQADTLPSWWRQNSLAARTVFFDGFAVRRQAGTRPSLDVLLEAAVEGADVRPGEPLRLIGDEDTAVILTGRGIIWPRGRWLPGG